MTFTYNSISRIVLIGQNEYSIQNTAAIYHSASMLKTHYASRLAPLLVSVLVFGMLCRETMSR